MTKSISNIDLIIRSVSLRTKESGSDVQFEKKKIYS